MTGKMTLGFAEIRADLAPLRDNGLGRLAKAIAELHRDVIALRDDIQDLRDGRRPAGTKKHGVKD